jgi:hypothetical protein
MSLLKGFISLFDWMFPPKTYQELSDDLDEKMQELYDSCGWGTYNNPLNHTRSISSEEWNSRYIDPLSEVEKVLNTYKPGTFIPYAIYDKQDDTLISHFKDGEYVSIILNDTVTVFKSNYGSEIIGCRIHNINKLIK